MYKHRSNTDNSKSHTSPLQLIIIIHFHLFNKLSIISILSFGCEIQTVREE